MTAQVTILAAGRGSRLGPHTDHTPKCLLPFAGRPLLDWQRAAFAANGITDLGVVRGYLGSHFTDRGMWSCENPRWADTNMVCTLLCARERLEAGGDVIVSYGDIIFEPKVVAALLDAPGDIVTVIDHGWLELWRARNDDPLADAETLKIGPSGRLTDIGRPAERLEEIEAQYIGLTYFSAAGMRAFLDFHDAASPAEAWLMGRSLETCYMTDILRGLIGAGHAVQAAPITGGWLEFDTVSDLEMYNRLLRDGGLGRFFKPWDVPAEGAASR